MDNTRINGMTLTVVRAILDLSQSDVGQMIGVTKNAVSKLENGETNAMTVTNTKLLFEALNLTPRELVAVQTAIRQVKSKFREVTK